MLIQPPMRLLGVVVTIVENILPAMAAAKRGAIDATQPAIDAAANANTRLITLA